MEMVEKHQKMEKMENYHPTIIYVNALLLTTMAVMAKKMTIKMAAMAMEKHQKMEMEKHQKMVKMVKVEKHQKMEMV
ncbi:hypothetical protein GLOIN_2v1528907, partial [Rhizophagus irregularis DAOM 181602=DAOM 197198]